ncbi:hypothetical protein MMC28_004327 [Mycoblastus sanguinarius]|nr:hypothetical protein [Mycoblastus sanguinarius]
MTTVDAEKPLLQPAESRLRPKKPNYGKIHAKRLPLNTYPLPLLIPHNPLSILHIAFTYICQLFTPLSSHPETILQAYFSPETRSVHVTDEATIRLLWEQGFFGKGSLSRSEPSWLDREKKKRGLIANETSEELTQQRREERKKFKNERARTQREAIEEKLKEEKQSKGNGTPPEPTARARFEGLNGGPVDSLAESIDSLIMQQPEVAPLPEPIVVIQSNDAALEETPAVILDQAANITSTLSQEEIGAAAAAIENQEHQQLTVEEAFFLVYALGILQVQDQSSSVTIPTDSLFTMFRQYSYFPPRQTKDLQPDDPFITSYAVYHHFRSLGWVVRPGIKFAVDWMLYIRGPVFSHAEFAVIVLPSYSHPYWRSTKEQEIATKKKESKSWWWLHRVNRVQSHVKKSLVLVYVEVPPPARLLSAQLPGDGKDFFGQGKPQLDISAFLKHYKVRELTLKRWIPNRERD